MRLLFIVFLLITSRIGYSQDLVFARKMVDTLSSDSFWGRGYTRNGLEKAAGFISNQFKSFGLSPMNGDSYFQHFSYPVNTFPGKMKVRINGKKLIPGRDYIVSPDSKGGRIRADLQARDSNFYFSSQKRLFVSFQDKLTWGVSRKPRDSTFLLVKKDAINRLPVSKVIVNIKSEFLPEFSARNVCGVIKGTRNPDSLIFITAHYDHLGGMGKKTYFPGANDNASGVSMLLSLARFYAQHPQPYSIAFICFAGEEAGLIGSEYFVGHPLADLRKIRFLINLDLTGTGEEGITVVNATEQKEEFALLKELNSTRNYVPKVNSRGKAANSDHYWFARKGVPSFFIYTMGGIKAYHDVYDVSSTLPLTSFGNLFKLITDFNRELMN